MQNPMLAQLGAKNLNPQLEQRLKGIKSVISTARSAGNPQAMMQSMIQNDPRYSRVLQMVQQAGGDPQAAFYSLARQMGVDPQQVIDALK